ncbi:MAG: sodium:alanine symporter family protein [Oscillospiraceae bacterium]|nr:sodium:alanine symporter family protein [Candidatus Limimonas coprohippi]
MEAFSKLITNIDDFVWGWTLIGLILATGLYLTIRSGAVQFLHLGRALKYMVRNEEDGEGEVTSFQALCTALSATVGTGNIVGVATAICVGGPGALFWMLVAACLGMATKYAECLLSVLYREKAEDGHYLGGPFLYIEKGMGEKWKWLAKLFAIFGALAGLLGIGTMTQINGIVSAFDNIAESKVLFTIGSKPITLVALIVAIVVTACVALVVIGGIKRISAVAEKIVPFMCVFYFVFAIVVILINIKAVPAAIVAVFAGAFSTQAAIGGFAGAAIKLAMQKGIGRGIFSNEAGLGSAPIAAAAAQTKEPVRQGLVSMTGVFIDTIVICTLTGLSIIVTGAYSNVQQLRGAAVTQLAWSSSLPWSPVISNTLLAVCLALFAFTTILGWDYYSERCVEYLTKSKKAVVIFRILFVLFTFAGPFLALDVVWNIADIFNGLMAFPNLVALIALGGVVAKETKAYFEKVKAEK